MRFKCAHCPAFIEINLVKIRYFSQPIYTDVNCIRFCLYPVFSKDMSPADTCYFNIFKWFLKQRGVFPKMKGSLVWYQMEFDISLNPLSSISTNFTFTCCVYNIFIYLWSSRRKGFSHSNSFSISSFWLILVCN